MVDPVEPDADKVRGEATPAITPAPDVVGMTAPIADEKTVVTKAKSPVVKLVAAPAAKAPAQGIEVTPRALDKIRSGMAKEGVSPTEGGLRLGILGGGCSGKTKMGCMVVTTNSTFS